MAEEIRSDRKISPVGRIFLVLGVLLLMAVAYVAAVLLQSPDEQANRLAFPSEREDVPRMQPAAMSSPQALSELFGAPLLSLPGYAMTGEGTNADYEGTNARIATLRYSGVTISAVRPAAAAPLLLRGELSVNLRGDLSVLNLPAMLAEKGNARCVYFSSTDAAYSVYAPQAGEEDFFAMLEKLQWTE